MTNAHPYDPLNSTNETGHSSGDNPDRDPLTTADTLTNGSLESPTRATPPPQRVETNPHLNVPMPLAHRPPGVSEYKPSYEEHTFAHTDVAVYNPEGAKQ